MELILVLLLLVVIAGGLAYREYWAGMPPQQPIEIISQPVPTPILGDVRQSDSELQSATDAIGIDLNRTSVWELTTVLKIDRGLAEQIVAYREKLGGAFDDPRRVLEIPAVSPERYQQWAAKLRLSSRSDLETAPKAFLDLNRASKLELESVPGIGSVLADRILDARNGNGPFESWDEVMEIDGIGLDRLDQLKSRFVLNSTDGIDLGE